MTNKPTLEQSPFLSQVWTWKPNFGQLLIVLGVSIVVKTIFSFIKETLFGLQGGITSFLIDNLVFIPLFCVLFVSVHRVSLHSIFNTEIPIRIKHIIIGLGAGLFVFAVEMGINIMFTGVKDYTFDVSLENLIPALIAGLLLGTAYALKLSIGLGYVYKTLLYWFRFPLLCIPFVILYMEHESIYLLIRYKAFDWIPYMLLNSLVMVIMITWVSMDDGLELIAGYGISASLFSNFIARTGSGAGAWGRTIVELELKSEGFGASWMGIIFRILMLLLLTVAIAKVLNWSNWRGRMRERYTKQVAEDEWGDKIDEIGSS
ncbi:MAG: hypothetical protein AB8F95_22830 [Bacteroidia bacterium]